jgi:predicted dehydrogenase
VNRIRTGLYGTSGHQIQAALVGHPFAELAAVSAFDAELPEGCAGVRVHDSFDALLADPDIDLVSLCSPRRADQAAQAVRALRAGKHVYAEKPCALAEADLDAILAAVRETGRRFHEMAGVSFEQPYLAMREAVRSGELGEVVQVLAQKSYPWTAQRPPDEDVDGGLGTQVGIYLARFVEHVAGAKITGVEMIETQLGNPVPDHGCRMAVAVQMTLANGGLAAGVANYLNPAAKRAWGYEMLRVFGTDGIVESVPGTSVVRLLARDRAPVELDTSAATEDYFTLFAGSLLGLRKMPVTIEEELSPTRWIIRAKQAARLIHAGKGQP